MPLAAVLRASCMARSAPRGFLLVLPPGALVARYAQATGSPRAFLLHRLLQFGVVPCLSPSPPVVLHSTTRHLAGASIAGGTIAYLFMDSHGSSIAHKVGGVGLVLLRAALALTVRCWRAWGPARVFRDVARPHPGRPVHTRVVCTATRRPCPVRCRRDDGATAVWICEGEREGRVRGVGHASSKRRTRGARGGR
ncbi:hypothetical protein EDB84DRAFT_337834 [Lactarius hengduanensis]|nr:hypothetical protein EDB84DRAFT_337834 [Lactarius hengduanensis]